MTITRCIRERSVTVYATSWCPHSRGAKALLVQRAVPYNDVDIERDPKAARQVELWNDGYRSVPTILVRAIVSEPTNADLELILLDSNARLLACTVYLTGWCPDCQRTVAWLNRNRIPYTAHDIDADEQAALNVEGWNQGNRSVPTLDLTLLLTEPSGPELCSAVGLIAR